jgi:DedD protein
MASSILGCALKERMETRIKERLVGAIVLVAIVVVVVPELLTGPRREAAANGSSAAPVRSVTIDLASGERGAITRPPLVAQSSSAAAALQTNSPVALESSPPPATQSTQPVAAAAAAPVPLASVPVKPAIAAPVSARPTAADGGAEGWVVQLGSFSIRENAEHLASTLRGQKYAAFVVEFRGSGRILYRVRVGPEQDRARAEAIAARLAHEGHRGSVAPQP